MKITQEMSMKNFKLDEHIIQKEFMDRNLTVTIKKAD